MKSAKLWVALGLVGLCASPFAMAAEGWYAGVGAGQSSARYDYAGMAANAGAGALLSTKPHDTAYNLFAGYMLNDYMGFEGGYFNLGKFGINTTAGAGTSKVDGFNLDFISLIPLTQKFAFEVKLGGNYANTRDSFPGATIASASQNELNLHMGAGVQYDIAPSVKVRGEWQRYIVNDGFNTRSPINTYTVSLVFPFGSEPAPAAVPAPAPAPVPRAVEAPAAAPEKLTLSAGSLFDFDKADVKPEGKKSLDKLATDLQSVNYDAISVTGHTDRIGSDGYNMKLSVRRAESVKKYLVDAHGIAPTKIFTTGKGKTDPVTKPGECKGKKVTKKLIECLQPDRRVVVEVSGTKK